jgi:probable rRNA maturation factor
MLSILLEHQAWQTTLPQVETLCEAAARLALARGLAEAGFDDAATAAALATGDGSLVLSDDASVQALNADYRDKDQPTNVLSFPQDECLLPDPALGPAAPPWMIGDIVLAFETCQREAQEQAKPLAAHLQHLVVHGCLHLLGHDHLQDAEAERMEALERAVLADLGWPDPYAAIEG